MPNYIYYCSRCKNRFEIKKSMNLADKPEKCRKCGQVADRLFTPLPNSFGWKLPETDKAQEYGRAKKEELVRNI